MDLERLNIDDFKMFNKKAKKTKTKTREEEEEKKKQKASFRVGLFFCSSW